VATVLRMYADGLERSRPWRGLTTRDGNGNSIRAQAVLTIVPFWLLVSLLCG
jgi:hypothetical protein